MFKDTSIFYLVFKRISDLVFSLLGLFILSPLFLLIILILKHTAEKEVFYLQERMGLNNKPFYIYKFATMIKNSQNIGSKTVTLRTDPRVTRFGKILRISKINELPQILNVIKGDMSLVGPRPLLTSSFKKYTLIALSTLILSQIFINVGVTINLLPSTGMTFSFLSYGGSSILTSAFIMGIILALTKNKL